MRAILNFVVMIALCASSSNVRSCRNPHKTANIMNYHLFSQKFHEQKTEDGVLVSSSSDSNLRHCHATIENCCSQDAENIYLSYKFSDDLNSVSKISFIRGRLDKFFPIFIRPFLQSLEYALVDLFHYVVDTGVSPFQLSSTISRLYSSILSTISLSSTSTHLITSIKNFFSETKLLMVAQLTGVSPGLQHCLSSQFDLLNSMEITSSKSSENTTFIIQSYIDKELIKFMEHYFFFIEISSSIEKQKLTDTCAESFEQLFLCRLCRGKHENTTTLIYNSSIDVVPVPQVIRLVGYPCPNRCLNVVRGCHAGLVGLRNPLSHLSRDFIELCQLLRNTSTEGTLTGALLSKNAFVESIESWTTKIERQNQDKWVSIGGEIQKRCNDSPKMPQMDFESIDWKSEVAEFLLEATSEAIHARSRTHPRVPQWTIRRRPPKRPSVRNETVIAQLRLAQQRSYLAMEQLIRNYMTPEKLFFEHLGQPCLEGSSKNCWNGNGFHNELEQISDFTMQGQLKNPAVRVTSGDLLSLNSRLVPKMLAHSNEIRSLIQYTKRKNSGVLDDIDAKASVSAKEDSLFFYPHPQLPHPPIYPIPNSAEDTLGGPLGLDGEEPLSDFEYISGAETGSGFYPGISEFEPGLDPIYHGNGSDDYNDWGSFPVQGESSLGQVYPYIEDTYSNKQEGDTEDNLSPPKDTTSSASFVRQKLFPLSFLWLLASTIFSD